MVGERYWSTGITISAYPDGRWGVWLDFHDAGFCQMGSTNGRLRCRYQVEDLARAIDTLIADAKQLGIVWADNVPGCPSVYAKGGRGDLQLVANEQAARLGWPLVYKAAVL